MNHTQQIDRIHQLEHKLATMDRRAIQILTRRDELAQLVNALADDLREARATISDLERDLEEACCNPYEDCRCAGCMRRGLREAKEEE